MSFDIKLGDVLTDLGLKSVRRKFFLSKEVLVLASISLFSYVLYFRRISGLSLSQDGLLISCLQYADQLPNFYPNGPKEPGRPFLSFAWNLALYFGNGSVDGYNIFMYVCITLSSIFAFILLRLMLGRKYILIACLAAITKLVWSANYELFDNSSLATYFAETTFFLACLIFTILNLFKLGRWQTFLASLCLGSLLIIASGIYQLLWLPVLFFPPLFKWLKPIKATLTTHLTLFIWYIPSVASISLCYALSRKFASRVYPELSAFVERFIYGFRAATLESLFTPFQNLKVNFYSISNELIIVLTGLILLNSLLLSGSLLNWEELEQIEYKKHLAHRLFWSGLLLISIGLLPFCILYLPTYGSRFMHWASLGSILLIFSLAAYLLERPAKLSKIVAILLLNLVVFTHSLDNLKIGHHYEISSYDDRQFLMQLVRSVPSLAEGSFVVFEDSPVHIGTISTDDFCTFILRNFTGTQRTFCFSEDIPSVSDGKVSIQTNLDLNSFGKNSYPNYPDLSVQGRSEVYLPMEKVIWLSWDHGNLELSILPSQNLEGNVSSLHTSNYGKTLFPDYENKASHV